MWFTFLTFISFLFFSQKLCKTNQKSSKELYREAAEMLGISCEFTENCRCLDCQVTAVEKSNYEFVELQRLFYLFFFFNFTLFQSRYFDCDDDDDSESYSNLSAVIDAEEFSPDRVESDETIYYCKGDDGYCNYGNGTCEDVEDE